MSDDPNQPSDGPLDPYAQPPTTKLPYPQPSSPYAPPSSTPPYGQPQPTTPYAPPSSTPPYGQTAPLPVGDPYAPAGGTYVPPTPPFNFNGPYANPAAPYGYPGAQPGYPPPPPPKKGIAGWIIGAILTAVVLVIGVCSFGGYLVIHQANAYSTSGATPSASPTNQVPTAPSTEASPADGRPVIHPAGATFSYRLPTGFHTVPSPASHDTNGVRATATSAAATRQSTDSDILIAAAFSLEYPVTVLNRTQLATQLDKLVKQNNQNPFTRQNVTYNGNFGFRYQFRYTNGDSAYNYFLFSGTNEVQVRCEWSAEETTIKTGCEDLLNSLTIAP